MRKKQHMEALEQANRVRLARAETKLKIRTGRLDVSDVVREVSWEMETIMVHELLRSQQRWGMTRSRRVLSKLAIHERKKLGNLTLRQREALAQELTRINHGEAAVRMREAAKKREQRRRAEAEERMAQPVRCPCCERYVARREIDPSLTGKCRSCENALLSI